MLKLWPLLLALALLSGCAQPAGRHETQDEALLLDTLSADGYEATVAAICADTRPYEGRQIRLTGTYSTDGSYAFLTRPAQDGGDPVGFELLWDGEAAGGDELYVEGSLASYLEDGVRYLRIEAERVVNESALARAEPYEVPEADFLPALAALYEDAQLHEGKLVTISGRLALESCAGTVYLSVRRTARYLDGSSAPVGLEFCWDGELPEAGAWITVTGLLRYRTQDGESYPCLQAVSLSPCPAGQETICEAQD